MLSLKNLQRSLKQTVNGASQVALAVKNLSAQVSASDIRDEDSTPGLGRSPGERHGNPLQYSCLENAMDRGAWWASVHHIAKSWTRLKGLNMHAHSGGRDHNFISLQGIAQGSCNEYQVTIRAMFYLTRLKNY